MVKHDLLGKTGLRVNRCVRRHVQEIQKGGGPVLRRKVVAVLGIALAVLPGLLVYALRPLVLVRFGPLLSSRVGHFAADAEQVLAERDMGMQPKAVDIFHYGASVANRQLAKMVERRLRVCGFARSLHWVSRRLPGGERHTVSIIGRDMYQNRDTYGLLAQTPIHLSFTPKEERRGQDAGLKCSIPNGVPFVCFHARDSAYLDNMFPGRDWRYHDWRDVSIHSYIPAAEELVRRGYLAVRMGAIVKEPLRTTNPGIIDYATRGRTDFLDIYLTAKCRFFIGCGSGLDHLASVFRRPVALVSFVALEYVPTWGPNDLFIPQKLWSHHEDRLLTFREILQSGIGRIQSTERYKELGIELIENTPEEITALAVEMDERLNGTWRTTEEDEDLQREFWSLFQGSKLHGKIVSRIGAEFLRQNRELLG